MARILCAVWPLTSHLNQITAVAKALQARGHDIGFYSGGAARALAENEGFTFFPFESLARHLLRVIDGVSDGSAASDDAAFYDRAQARYTRKEAHKHLLSRIKLLQQVSREWHLGGVPHQLEDIEAITDRWRPDAVLCDASLFGPILVLYEARGLPVAVLPPCAGCLIPGPDAPPIGLGLPRPRNRRTRAQAGLVAMAMRLFTTQARRMANDVRDRYGLPPITGSVAALSARMPLYLVPTAREFDYDRHDLPPSVHYVGPCQWDKPSGEAPPDWLNELPDDQPLVYVTEGTAHSRDAVLLTAAARGLANLPLRVIMTTGRHRHPAELGLTGLAANIRVEQYVPHSLLYPRLTAAVTHGGCTGVRAALTAGIPQVVVPMEADQCESAQRVVEAGAGLRLSERRCTPESLRAALWRVLEEPSFRTNARWMGTIMARYGGPDYAAELLERMCQDAEYGAPTQRTNEPLVAPN